MLNQLPSKKIKSTLSLNLSQILNLFIHPPKLTKIKTALTYHLHKNLVSKSSVWITFKAATLLKKSNKRQRVIYGQTKIFHQ